MNTKGPITNRSALEVTLRDKLRQDGRALCQFATELGAGFNDERLLARFEVIWHTYPGEWSATALYYLVRDLLSACRETSSEQLDFECWTERLVSPRHPHEPAILQAFEDDASTAFDAACESEPPPWIGQYLPAMPLGKKYQLRRAKLFGRLLAAYRHARTQQSDGLDLVTECWEQMSDELREQHFVAELCALFLMPQPGHLINKRYELETIIGIGGMGIVYRAMHPELGRVALKLMRGDCSLRERFLQEARVTVQLVDRRFLIIKDAGVDEATNLPFFTMDEVEGGKSLTDLIDHTSRFDRHTLDALRRMLKFTDPDQGHPWYDSLFPRLSKPGRQLAGPGDRLLSAVVMNVADAIATLHEHGHVHCDLKPGNILISRKYLPIVGDLGLSRPFTDGLSTAPEPFVGTVPYSSPEQLNEKGLTRQSDVYQLGAILYRGIVGHAPFKQLLDEKPVDFYRRVRNSKDDIVPPSLLGIAVNKDLEAICMKALRTEPAKRYRSALELAADLGRYLKGEPVSASPHYRRRQIVRACIRSQWTYLFFVLAMVTGLAVWLSDLSLVRVRWRGQITFATEPTYPPMAYWKDMRKTRIIGYEIDFANELAKRLRVKKVVPVAINWPWENALNGLNERSYDMVIATVTHTPTRAKQAEFVDYDQIPTVIVGKRGLGVKDFRDLAGKRAAVQKGTRAEEWVHKLINQGIAIIPMKPFSGADEPFAALFKKDGADITFAHEPVAYYYANRDRRLEVVNIQLGNPIEPDDIGIAFRKEDRALQSAVKEAVDGMKADNVLIALKRKWIRRRGIPYYAVIAHRGASYDAPESTAASYLLARDLGADYLELDLQRTKDGILVVLHDETLERTTDVALRFPERVGKPVSEFTLAELRELDAGTWFNQAYPQRARRSFEGLKILTLDEVIDIAEGGFNKPGLYIETKNPRLFPGIEKELADKLEKRGWIGNEKAVLPNSDAERQVDVAYGPGRVVLQTLEKSSFELLQRLMPEIPTVLLLWLGDNYIEPKTSVSFEKSGDPDKASFYAKQEVKSVEEFAGWLDWAKAHGAVATGAPATRKHGGEQSYMDLVRSGMNRMAHERGLFIHAYTVDDTVDFKELHDRRVDGFFTNRPAELLKFYGSPPKVGIDTILEWHEQHLYKGAPLPKERQHENPK